MSAISYFLRSFSFSSRLVWFGVNERLSSNSYSIGELNLLCTVFSPETWMSSSTGSSLDKEFSDFRSLIKLSLSSLFLSTIFSTSLPMSRIFLAATVFDRNIFYLFLGAVVLYLTRVPVVFLLTLSAVGDALGLLLPMPNANLLTSFEVLFIRFAILFSMIAISWMNSCFCLSNLSSNSFFFRSRK